MNRWSSTLLSILTLLICLAASVAYAQVTQVSATVDKNPAMADESIVLTVTAVGDADRNDFDPSVLADNFVVGRTSVSSQTRMVNFQTTSSVTWTTILIPRRQGTFTIPSFDIDGQPTQPIPVRIIPPVASGQGQARDIFVTAELDRQQSYIQQQIKYTVKIHIGAELQRGSLGAPVLENAEVKPLGEDKNYTDIIDGNRYRIIERSFAIIPQSSGKVTIKGTLFEGEIIDSRRQTFGYFNQTKPINRIAPDMELTVLPIPADYTEHWLPSEFVQLNEEWQPALDELKAGEPVTRTLTLTALGVLEEQLPDITGSYPPDFKTYPDQATTASVVKDKTLIVQRIENIAVIPSREGQFVLPEVVVPWFNVSTKQTQYARIPARSIKVVQGDISAQANVAPPIGEIAPTQVDSKPLYANNQSPVATEVQTIEITSFWSLSSWLFLALWLATILLWWYTSSKKIQPRQRNAVMSGTEQQHWATLVTALKTNEGNEIFPALGSWLKIVLNRQTATLPECQVLLNDNELDQEIKLMFAKRYSNTEQHWKSDKLRETLDRIRSDRKRRLNNSDELHALYS